jgi:hypothetical protein
MKNLLTAILMVFILTSAVAQTEVTEKVYVKNAFINTQLITAQTTEMLPKKSWEFKIQHRFAKTGFDSTLIQEFIGMDQTANIRLSFGYSLGDRLYIAVGRTKYLKNYDFEAKYLLIKQAKEQKIPVSVALYGNTAVRTEKFPAVPPNAFFSDWTTPFEYKLAHRFSYNTQLIISSKITDALSLQLTPIFVYHNLVSPGQVNHTLAVSFSGRYKMGLNSAVIFEYGHVINHREQRAKDFVNPGSIGVEFGSAGHCFQIFVSSTQSILDQNVFTNSSIPYADAEFLLGFNIKRNFWRK